MAPSVSGAPDQSLYHSFSDEHSSNRVVRDGDEAELATEEMAGFDYADDDDDNDNDARLGDGTYSYADDEGMTRDSSYGLDEEGHQQQQQQQQPLGGLQRRRTRNMPSFAAESTGDAYADGSNWGQSASRNITATSGFLSHDGLEAMEFSTRSAGGVQRQAAHEDVTGESYGGYDDGYDDEFDEDDTGARHTSFHSDGQVTTQQQMQQQQQQQVQGRRRPESFHDSGSSRRLARLVQRYQGGGPREPQDFSGLGASTAELSDAADGASDVDLGDLSMPASSVGSPASRRSNGRIALSVVERTRTALQRRMALDAASDAADEAEADAYSQVRLVAGGMRAYAARGMSAESLEHPNMGSQHSERSFAHSTATFDGEHSRAMYTRPESPFAQSEPADQYSSFGSLGHADARRPRESSFAPMADGVFSEDERTGTPAWSDVVRENEHAFDELVDSDEERAPDSLFVSSASIVAALRPERWDGREATRRAMRVQEQRFGVHQANPIEMLGKASSLGVDDAASDVSGLPPSDARSPGGVPPTTPTTFLARDRRHGPVRRDPQRIPAMTPPPPRMQLQLPSSASPTRRHTPQPASPVRLLQRLPHVRSASSTPASTRSYVPFQEPTIDVSRVADYRRVAPGPPMRVSERPLDGQPAAGSSRSPTVACSTPERVRSPVADRPVAPTPRRAAPVFRRFVADAPGWDDGCDEPLKGHPEIRRMRSEDGRARVRQQLQRFASEQAADTQPPVREPARPEEPAPAQPVPAKQADALNDLSSPLADKLLDLVAALAGTRDAKSAEASDNAALRSELLGLQRDILRRFDEYRGEVHQLREDVRRVSALPQSPSAAKQQQHADVVAPSDSVSVAGDHGDTGDFDDALSDTSTTVPDRSPRRHVPVGDLLANRKTLDALRSTQRAEPPGRTSIGGRLAETLADLQHVHLQRYHRGGALQASGRRGCHVCRVLAQTPGLGLASEPTAASSYAGLGAAQMHRLLGAYVAAMQDEYAGRRPALRHAHTPSSSLSLKQPVGRSVSEQDSQVVIGLLREELEALRRRYRRLVDEYAAVDPADGLVGQRRRRALAGELKHLVDLLDVKAEQIAVLAALHPEPPRAAAGGREGSAAGRPPRKAFWDDVHSDGDAAGREAPWEDVEQAAAERALRSAKDLQRVLDEMYG
ncbi:hypothetical protein GGI15_003389 [Coemansia interrupta]|uniref:Cep57 centrosome microtubule-binding domain-containing protein n=1 Tax=Coemansia interrupta TaxID=1126814 RepID=A0A9W8LIY6_9FUNG|nr:hypothetical protein GGI15_003389 [Coemansia interrupta]